MYLDAEKKVEPGVCVCIPACCIVGMVPHGRDMVYLYTHSISSYNNGAYAYKRSRSGDGGGGGRNCWNFR